MASMHRSWHELPTVMVSFGNPFALLDAPGLPTYLNAYGATAATQRVVVDVLLGRTAATGRSPVDTRAAICAFSITDQTGAQP
jgi:beta-N-acetylhexosaminidase